MGLHGGTNPSSSSFYYCYLTFPLFVVTLLSPQRALAHPQQNAHGGCSFWDRTRHDGHDYVIAGGGTSGLVVANRLSADPATRVAVIEAGGDARADPNVTSVLGFLSAFGTAIDWAYTMVPQAALGGRSDLTYHAGRALGGTSTINGMTFLRGDAPEFDAWERLGNPGWNWAALWPHFLGIERFRPPTDTQVANGGVEWTPGFHGEAGELATGYPFELVNGTLHSTWQDTWGRLGIPRRKDPNGGDIRGCNVWPQTLDRDADIREDAARAFLHPVEDRPNLHVIQGTVRRIIWKEGASDSAEAAGVEYLTPGGETVVLGVNKEVILSAGALRSPGILEMSGIGHPSILEPLGIETKVNLPGVGENMIEQPLGALIYTADLGNLTGTITPFGAFLNAEDLFGNETEGIAASTRASLPDWAASVSAANGGLVDAAALLQAFEVQHDLIFRDNVTIAEILSSAVTDLLAQVCWPLLPFSRGSVHIQPQSAASSSSSSSSSSTDNGTATGAAADVADRPAIDPKYLLADFDVAVMTATGRAAQAFAYQAPMADLVTGYSSPGDAVLPRNATDAQWEAVLRAGVSANHHALGTAAMMSRELGGVVDPQLRVYGTTNVRVVDASVLPLQISGHLTATLYAVADRAAAIILGKV